MRKMEMIVDGTNLDSPITRMGEFPPCFDNLRAYEEWKEACLHAERTGVPLPPRPLWPKEPNYCRECTSAHRNRMREEGRCMFPSTIFVEEGEGEDIEVIGEER